MLRLILQNKIYEDGQLKQDFADIDFVGSLPKLDKSVVLSNFMSY